MRRGRLVGVAVALAAIVGCGGGEDAPAACDEGAEAVLAALRSAPGNVRLDGARLSDCLTEEGGTGELESVGTAYVAAAAALARSARRRPDGSAALQLGYLVGAARRGASDTQGVHTELIRRLEQEASGVDTGATAFRRGERAGRRLG